MKLFVRLFILSCTFLLISCSYFSKQTLIANRDKQYLSARSIPPLKIPPDGFAKPFQSTYPVSNQYYPEAAKKVSIVPPGLN
jgi:uncharacterized lipoprotein